MLFDETYICLISPSGYKFLGGKDCSSCVFISLQCLKGSQMREHNKWWLLNNNTFIPMKLYLGYSCTKSFICISSRSLLISHTPWTWLSVELPKMCLPNFLLKKKRNLLSKLKILRKTDATEHWESQPSCWYAILYHSKFIPDLSWQSRCAEWSLKGMKFIKEKMENSWQM